MQRRRSPPRSGATLSPFRMTPVRSEPSSGPPPVRENLASRSSIVISGLSRNLLCRTRPSAIMNTTDPPPVSQPFQAEVSELLHLMVHSVYSETDIFLRELISNASDACDRLRYEAIANPALIADGEAPKIRIVPNKKDDTLVVADSG